MKRQRQVSPDSAAVGHVAVPQAWSAFAWHGSSFCRTCQSRAVSGEVASSDLPGGRPSLAINSGFILMLNRIRNFHFNAHIPFDKVVFAASFKVDFLSFCCTFYIFVDSKRAPSASRCAESVGPCVWREGTAVRGDDVNIYNVPYSFW